MDIRSKRMLIILGGLYHDFACFAHAMKCLFEADDWSVEATYDLDVLAQLNEEYKVALSYTCLSKNTLERVEVRERSVFVPVSALRADPHLEMHKRGG